MAMIYRKRYSFILLFLLLAGAVAALQGDKALDFSLPEALYAPLEQDQDTVARFPVAKTLPEGYEDLISKHPADLKSPENITTTIEYD